MFNIYLYWCFFVLLLLYNNSSNHVGSISFKDFIEMIGVHMRYVSPYFDTYTVWEISLFWIYINCFPPRPLKEVVKKKFLPVLSIFKYRLIEGLSRTSVASGKKFWGIHKKVVTPGHVAVERFCEAACRVALFIHTLFYNEVT